MRHTRRSLCLALAVLAALLALMQLAGGARIYAKAALAQALLERAWVLSERGARYRPPWPWADTAPVARLRVPALGVDEIVLRGDSGHVLAFAPGWTPSSAPPGSTGVSVISGHRDTHFAFLRELHAGETIVIERDDGTRRYRVSSSLVADALTQRAPAQDMGDALLLVTCYPFDAIMPGGRLRYVVTARPIEPAISHG